VFLPCCAPFSHYGNFIQQRDAALLLSGYDFLGAAAGLATVGTICSKSLGGAIVQTAGLSGNECLRGHDLLFAVSAWIGFDEIAFFSIWWLRAFDCLSDAFVASIASHELGHLLGAQHDGSGNACPVSGFIMNAVLVFPPTTFSSCSTTVINAVQSACLANGARFSIGQVPSGLWGFIDWWRFKQSANPVSSCVLLDVFQVSQCLFWVKVCLFVATAL
jgi:hypothetical protein